MIDATQIANRIRNHLHQKHGTYAVQTSADGIERIYYNGVDLRDLAKAIAAPEYAPTGAQRPRLGLWAPGTYECRCGRCLRTFIGAKGAMVCAPCSYPYDDRNRTFLVESSLFDTADELSDCILDALGYPTKIERRPDLLKVRLHGDKP